MEGLTLSTKEQSRLKTLNGVLERHWSMREAASLLGVSHTTVESDWAFARAWIRREIGGEADG